MLPSRRPRPRWPLPLAAVVVGAVAWWALADRPPASLAAVARGYSTLALRAADSDGSGQARPPASCADWRIYLTWDEGARGAGAEWTLHEGRQPGEGYSLRWVPSRLALHLVRGGERPVLLAALRLAAPPREIQWRRRGARLVIEADAVPLMTVIDAEPPPAPSWWGFATAAPRDETEISLHLDRQLGDDPERLPLDDDPGRLRLALEPFQALPQRRPWWAQLLSPRSVLDRPHQELRLATALVRQAMAATAESGYQAYALSALGAARIFLSDPTAADALATATDRSRLRRWLTLAEIRLVAASGGLGDDELDALADDLRRPRLVALPAEAVDAERSAATRVADAVESLIADSRPEDLGLLLSLVDSLIERASRPPEEPAAMRELLRSTAPAVGANRPTHAALVAAVAGTATPAAVWTRRSAWLAIAGRILDQASALAGDGLTDDQRGLLALTRHGINCLLGSDPAPTPGEAPAWLTVRWRALAGSDPQATAWPDLPLASYPLGLAPAIARLQQLAATEPLAAVRWTARLTVADHATEPAEALRAVVQEFPAAGQMLEADLLRALVALHLDALARRASDPQVAKTAFDDAGRALTGLTGSRPSPWASTDPLAFALARLMLTRLPELVTRTAQSPAVGAVGKGKILGEPDSDLPAALAGYGELLSGKPQALRSIWAPLPADRALLTVLAMQEVTNGAKPDWTLLDLIPCRSLPTHFARPLSSAAGGPAGPVP